MDARAVYWMVIALAVGPIPLLLVTWFRTFSPRPFGRKLQLLLLIVATGSHLWLVAGMWFPAVLGDYHSNVRFAIFDVNFVVMLGCVIATFWSKGDGKVLVGIACLLTTILWSVVGAINASV